jgi:hypothetical protein
MTNPSERELRERLAAKIRDEWLPEAQRLIDRSEQLANNGEAHRSDISLARGREIEGIVHGLDILLQETAIPPGPLLQTDAVEQRKGLEVGTTGHAPTRDPSSTKSDAGTL